MTALLVAVPFLPGIAGIGFVIDVISVDDKTYSCDAWQEWYGDKQRGHVVNSGPSDGLSPMRAVDAVATDLAHRELGEKKNTTPLREWGISRQHTRGTPNPN